MLEIGSIVDGKYKILNIVGKGGMSVVYQAVNEKANKIWAIKEVRKDGVQNFEVVKQNLIVETELLKRFNHPNLPSIIDVIDGDGTFLIVMDYIEGNSLSKALETSGAQDQNDVIEWSKQLCDVLGYLHSRKPPVIYRDMKPSNVMLKPDGNVSLIDFGTAREFKSSSVEDTTCLGTQGYAAPEQYGGHGQTDARTDIYCLGATMYHLVTGHNPSTPPYEMYPIRQWNPMLSSGLEEIIIKCTQRNPNDRYQSCAELLYDLDHYQDLDIENKKVQSLKWKTFMVSLVLTIVMLLGTVGFTIAGSVVKSNKYETLLLQAQNSQDEKLFFEAIDVNPIGMEAYLGLLDLYTIGDGVLTYDEYQKLNKLMLQNEKALQESNPKVFADEFAYTLGKYMLLASGDSNDMRYTNSAANWLEKVYKEESADETNAKNAKALFALAKNSTTSVDIDGESKDKNLWNTLSEMKSIADDENDKIKLLIYKYIASTVYTKFDQLGVNNSEITSLLTQLQEEAERNLSGDYPEIAKKILDSIDSTYSELLDSSKGED